MFAARALLCCTASLRVEKIVEVIKSLADERMGECLHILKQQNQRRSSFQRHTTFTSVFVGRDDRNPVCRRELSDGNLLILS